MASLELDPSSGRYRVRFRYAGQEYKRSLRTQNRRVAAASLGQVEETLESLPFEEATKYRAFRFAFRFVFGGRFLLVQSLFRVLAVFLERFVRFRFEG